MIIVTVIKGLTRPARLAFAISLISTIMLVSLLVAHETTHGEVHASSDGGARADSHFCLIDGFR